MLTEWQRQQLAVWMRDIDKAGEWEWVIRALDEHVKQLAIAKKRASEAERMVSEIRPYEQMLAKALLKAFDRIGIELVHDALGLDASWVRNDLQTLAETDHMPARAQAVAEVLVAMRVTYEGHKSLGHDCPCHLCKAYAKLAALDKEN